MGDQNKPLIFFYISNLYAEKDSHRGSKRLQVITICKNFLYYYMSLACNFINLANN